MYVKISNGNVEKYPYSINELKQDNPQTSFPLEINETVLAEWNVIPVRSIPPPQVDAIYQTLIENPPKYINGEWVQDWFLTNATNEEILQRKTQYNEIATQNRLEAYRNESDPLFFKAQRNEITLQEWQSKIAEIKLRYPKI